MNAAAGAWALLLVACAALALFAVAVVLLATCDYLVALYYRRHGRREPTLEEAETYGRASRR